MVAKNDSQFSVLGVKGFAGTLQDRFKSFSKATSGSADVSYWKSLAPAATGTQIDIKRTALINSGIAAGPVHDMENQYWANQVTSPLLVMRDDFNGVAGTAIESHVANIGFQPWTSTIAGSIKLNGAGQAVDTSTGSANMSLIDPGLIDFTMDWAATGSSAADSSNVSIPDIIFRYVDANNFMKLFIDTRPSTPPSVLVIQKVGGTDNTQLVFTANPPVSGVSATGRIVVVGGNLNLTFNGGTASTTIPATSGTKVGLKAEGGYTPMAMWEFIQVSRNS